MGGLMAGARLARAGRRVLILEANAHIGGTSYIFRRRDFAFPMGPLSFSYPDRVEALLDGAGAGGRLSFRRNHFQLLTPRLDIVYSRPPAVLKEDLRRAFPLEGEGLDRFFDELVALFLLIRDIDRRHPDYALRAGHGAVGPVGDAGLAARISRIRELGRASSRELLEPLVRDADLRNLLGSMGTDPPRMSLLNLAFMWASMSEIGIWFPSIGIYGICDRLAAAVGEGGGEIRLRRSAAHILVEGGRAAGVRTADGEEFRAPVVIANADYKQTFLDLLNPADVPPAHLEAVRRTPYTGSELCVYLGLDASRVDWTRMRAEHLFFQKVSGAADDPASDSEDFDGREIEICRWSENAPDAAPPGKAVVVLRAGSEFRLFEDWRTGDRTRKESYREAKARLARNLVRTAEAALPGLSAAVEVLEAATPLTYRDWGRRTAGSIAGWSWSAEAAESLPGKILVETPIPGLFMAGIYAATELFLGGVPTALFTGSLAAAAALAYRA
jgi:phytoene dehydrogenase-like protein